MADKIEVCDRVERLRGLIRGEGEEEAATYAYLARRSAKALDAGLWAFSLSFGILGRSGYQSLRQVVSNGKIIENWLSICWYCRRPPMVLVVVSGVRHGCDVTDLTARYRWIDGS